MFHIFLHFLVPLIVSRLFYGKRWKNVFLVLIAAMIIDVDHLIADPIYDPTRCSIGFHPLHTVWAIIMYVLMFAVPIYLKTVKLSEKAEKWNQWIQLAGLGLLIHIVLDALDCLF